MRLGTDSCERHEMSHWLSLLLDGYISSRIHRVTCARCLMHLSLRRLGEDGTTCFMGQQMGFFDITDPADCDKRRLEIGYITPLEMLGNGAATCCKSKKVDRSVCKIDKCVSGVSFCFALGFRDFDDAAKQITHPKGMERNDKGQLQGSCAVAIFNGVERELCCTAGMKELPACVKREVGDYTLCRDSWTAAFDATFYAKAEAIDRAFKPGGYCVSGSARASVCSKCGSTNRGTRSCCAQGGAWYNNCGSADDPNVDHTWTEGALACKGKFAVSYVCRYICE